MIVGYSSVVSGVRAIAASTLAYTIATTQNATIPAATLSGDLLIAAVMHRDTITPPAGWTLVDSGVGVGVSSTIHQGVDIYKKTASGGDGGTSTTWTQASSVRMAVQILTFRGSAGTPTIIAHASDHLDATALNVINVPTSTATADGQMGIAFGTWIYTVGFTTMTIASGYSQSTPSGDSDNRLCGGYKRLLNGASTDGTISSDASDTDGAWGVVSLVIG